MCDGHSVEATRYGGNRASVAYRGIHEPSERIVEDSIAGFDDHRHVRLIIAQCIRGLVLFLVEFRPALNGLDGSL